MPEPVEYVPEGHEAHIAELVAPARDMESARDKPMGAGLMRKRQAQRKWYFKNMHVYCATAALAVSQSWPLRTDRL